MSIHYTPGEVLRCGAAQTRTTEHEIGAGLRALIIYGQTSTSYDFPEAVELVRHDGETMRLPYEALCHLIAAWREAVDGTAQDAQAAYVEGLDANMRRGQMQVES